MCQSARALVTQRGHGAAARREPAAPRCRTPHVRGQGAGRGPRAALLRAGARPAPPAVPSRGLRRRETHGQGQRTRRGPRRPPGMPGSLTHRGRRFRPDRGTQQLEAGPLGTRESLHQRAGASPGGPSRGAAGRDGGGRCRPLPRARSRPRRRAGAAAGRAAASWGGARLSRPQGPRVGVARPPGLLLPHALPGLSLSTAPCGTQSNVPRRVFVLDLSDSRTHTGHELIRCVSGCPSVSPQHMCVRHLRVTFPSPGGASGNDSRAGESAHGRAGPSASRHR